MGTRTNIMIIDDSYTNRVLLKAVLDDLDINVTEVSSGLKALKLLNGTSPDIILLDMCMPQMNGIDFLKEMKERNIMIPVIVISVLDDQTYMKQALQHGANEYLIKPLEINKLLTTIARFTEYEYIKQ
jgi:CheY-like chemotaxis protein